METNMPTLLSCESGALPRFPGSAPRTHGSWSGQAAPGWTTGRARPATGPGGRRLCWWRDPLGGASRKPVCGAHRGAEMLWTLVRLT